MIEISALQRLNLNNLLRALREKADLIEDYLHPNDVDGCSECTVIESLMAKDRKMLNVVVHWGFLVPGQWFISDTFIGKWLIAGVPNFARHN